MNPEKHKEIETEDHGLHLRRVLDDVALLRDVHAVKELSSKSAAAMSPEQPLSIEALRGRVSLTFRISLFRTRQICWMSAADWETASRELPDRTSSSFWALEISTSTPDCMMTLRTSFSPMKFLFDRENQPRTSPQLHWTAHDGSWPPIPGSLSNPPPLPTVTIN